MCSSLPPTLKHSMCEKVFHQLATFFNGLHWAIGITTLPSTATPRDERSFVLMWLGIIVFMIVFFAVFIYLMAIILCGFASKAFDCLCFS
jgi:hypothetical protein